MMAQGKILSDAVGAGGVGRRAAEQLKPPKLQPLAIIKSRSTMRAPRQHWRTRLLRAWLECKNSAGECAPLRRHEPSRPAAQKKTFAECRHLTHFQPQRDHACAYFSRGFHAVVECARRHLAVMGLYYPALAKNARALSQDIDAGGR